MARTKNGGEVYFYVGGKNAERERERADEENERKELFSREKENGREKFPSAVAPDLGRKRSPLKRWENFKHLSPTVVKSTSPPLTANRFKFVLWLFFRGFERSLASNQAKTARKNDSFLDVVQPI